MRMLIAAVVVVLLMACVAAAGGMSASVSSPVIAYVSSATLADQLLYVTGPGGTHEVGKGQDPSVAPDGLIVSGSASPAFRSAGPP